MFSSFCILCMRQQSRQQADEALGLGIYEVAIVYICIVNMPFLYMLEGTLHSFNITGIHFKQSGLRGALTLRKTQLDTQYDRNRHIHIHT
jgi:hypothetical protein